MAECERYHYVIGTGFTEQYMCQQSVEYTGLTMSMYVSYMYVDKVCTPKRVDCRHVRQMQTRTFEISRGGYVTSM